MASCVKEGRLYVGRDPHLGKIRGLDPWAVDNGIHVISITPEKTEGIMMIGDQNTQQYGTVHGGMLVAFADTIAGHSLVAHGKMCVTQSSTVNFLRPASGAYLFCRAIPVKVGRTVCVVSVEQRNDRDQLVTTALFTFTPIQDVEAFTLEPKYPDLTF